MPSVKVIVEPIKPARDDMPDRQISRYLKKLEGYFKGELAKDVKREFKKTTKNWDNGPEFVSEISAPYGTRLQLWVRPKGRYTTKWQRVSDGTAPHLIRAKRRPTLSFQPNYTPHTKPGGSYGGPGRKSGEYIHPKVVRHPGIEARKFSEEISQAEDWERKVSSKASRLARSTFR